MNQLATIGPLCALTLVVGEIAACSSPAPFVGMSTNGDGFDATAQGSDVVEAGIEGDSLAPNTSDAGMLGGWHPGANDGGSDAGEGGGPAPAVQTLEASIGPIPLATSQETTVCITLRLSNPDAVYVPRITVDLALGSHHLVVYRSKATTESLTPTPCTAFQGILMGAAVPVMISEKLTDDLTFPQGVALKIEPHQMIELEAHYINTGSTALQGKGHVRFETIPVTTQNVIESDLAFWGTLNVIIPPGTQSNGPMFATGLAGTHGFALTTHQHRLGSHFKVWYANSATDTTHAPVADTTDWANPPLYRLSPELEFNGQNGLAYQCTWDNTTGQLVTFGESALQEMCFLWMYYYPSHGFDMRFQ